MCKQQFPKSFTLAPSFVSLSVCLSVCLTVCMCVCVCISVSVWTDEAYQTVDGLLLLYLPRFVLFVAIFGHFVLAAIVMLCLMAVVRRHLHIYILKYTYIFVYTNHIYIYLASVYAILLSSPGRALKAAHFTTILHLNVSV